MTDWPAVVHGSMTTLGFAGSVGVPLLWTRPRILRAALPARAFERRWAVVMVAGYLGLLAWSLRTRDWAQAAMAVAAGAAWAYIWWISGGGDQTRRRAARAAAAVRRGRRAASSGGGGGAGGVIHAGHDRDRLVRGFPPAPQRRRAPASPQR